MDSLPAENVKQTPSLDSLDLGDPPEDWRGWFAYMALKFTVYVAKDPWGFLGTVLMIVTPLFMLGAFCAYKLAQELKKQEMEKKLKAKRSAAIAKSRKQVKAD
ncbi:hypothetical protein CRM22_004197 [Opisthorchis felineus]|uniref:Small integral membrane protein 15 n=1 Tax=Opisthorchis felineus TaxID=147828 RepID=A0A4S2LY99_OPIFE|nr:hypothetical protein CRM22_004197 [Opisthorchis felineus]